MIKKYNLCGGPRGGISDSNSSESLRENGKLSASTLFLCLWSCFWCIFIVTAAHNVWLMDVAERGLLIENSVLGNNI